MNEDTYYADAGVEYDGAEQREELGFTFKPYAPDYGPPAAPERPKAHINEWCEGCPYPAHGFVCWNRDGDCLRKRVLRMNQKKESAKYGAGTVKQ